MAVIGYARVSSVSQSFEVQLEQLRANGCDKIFSETKSGKSAANRPELSNALDYVREGDVFVVTRLDRLARSMVDLRQIVDRLNDKGVGFRALQQGAIDTTRSDGRLLLNVLASFSEFELDIRRERQAEGIQKAKAEGRYNGRPRKVDESKIAKLRAEGISPTKIARDLNISRASVYRVLAD